MRSATEQLFKRESGVELIGFQQGRTEINTLLEPRFSALCMDGDVL